MFEDHSKKSHAFYKITSENIEKMFEFSRQKYLNLQVEWLPFLARKFKRKKPRRITFFRNSRKFKNETFFLVIFTHCESSLKIFSI